MAQRARAFERRRREALGITALLRRFVQEHGPLVRHGPFAGLAYPTQALESQVDMPLAKLLGIYEEELHETLAAIIAEPPPVIVDLGAADGYYAVGLARACPTSVVHAYELARSGRGACRLLARANNVSLVMHRRASAGAVRSLALERAFVLCDIEGGEDAVFDLETVRALAGATVLVEVHEATVPGLTESLQARFTGHDCTIIPVRQATVPRELDAFSPADRALAAVEPRQPGMVWALFSPRR